MTLEKLVEILEQQLKWKIYFIIHPVSYTHLERILPQGTGYITDLGMVGPWDSILGVDKDLILKKFLTGLPVKFELAKGAKVFSAIIIHINECNGKVKKIFRILEKDLLKKIEKM